MLDRLNVQGGRSTSAHGQDLVGWQVAGGHWFIRLEPEVEHLVKCFGLRQAMPSEGIVCDNSTSLALMDLLGESRLALLLDVFAARVNTSGSNSAHGG